MKNFLWLYGIAIICVGLGQALVLLELVKPSWITLTITIMLGIVILLYHKTY